MTPTEAEISSAIQAFITRHFPVARQYRVGLHDSLIDLGIVDSLGVLEIVTFIDNDLGVTLADDEIASETFASIATIASLVYCRIAAETA